jgi:protein TonB
VQGVQRKVSENWLKYEVDPRITAANRVFVTFDITRDGRPSNVEIEQSSGIPSLDISATRAIQRIDTFGPLPPDYSGSRVSVEFWFDYKR